MIGLPFNDLRCLGSITEVIAELVTSTPLDPSIVSSVPPLTSNDVQDSSLISVPALSCSAFRPASVFSSSARFPASTSFTTLLFKPMWRP